jgi:hypothetical protein
MIENLESRQFMSVTLLTTDTTGVADTRPTAVVEASAKVKVTEIRVVKTTNTASTALM